MRTTSTIKKVVLTSSLVLGIVSMSVAGMFASSNQAFAANSCDAVNIAYCGLSGTTDATYISSFKSIYTTDLSGHKASPTVKKDYTDIQAVYKWAGATPAIVAGMNTTNTKLGTMYRDGHIAVDGKTVGTSAWVSARFTEGAGYTKVSDGVYARKTTTSLAEATAPVLVYMPNGQMSFAAMLACDNAVTATPVKVVTPTPTPVTPVKPVTPKPVTPVTTTPVTTPAAPVVTTAAAPVAAPTTLVNTGAGNVIGIFAGVSLAGAAAHYFLSRRRKLA